MLDNLPEIRNRKCYILGDVLAMLNSYLFFLMSMRLVSYPEWIPSIPGKDLGEKRERRVEERRVWDRTGMFRRIWDRREMDLLGIPMVVETLTKDQYNIVQ